MHNLFIAPVSLANLEAIYPPALQSLFWETGPVTDRSLEPSGSPDETETQSDCDHKPEIPSGAFSEQLVAFEKESWLNTVMMTWGQCGFSLLRIHDQRPVATIFFAPPRFCPTTFAMPSGPISPDAVALTSLHSDSIEVSTAAQLALINSAFKHLAGRGIRAVEAFGCSGNADEDSTGSETQFNIDEATILTSDLLEELVNVIEPKPCRSTALGAINHEAGEVIKTATLLKAGMKVETPHPVHPKLRMELNVELDWNEALGRALDRHAAGQYLSSRHTDEQLRQSSFSASKS